MLRTDSSVCVGDRVIVEHMGSEEERNEYRSGKGDAGCAYLYAVAQGGRETVRHFLDLHCC